MPKNRRQFHAGEPKKPLTSQNDATDYLVHTVYRKRGFNGSTETLRAWILIPNKRKAQITEAIRQYREKSPTLGIITQTAGKIGTTPDIVMQLARISSL